MHFAVSVAGGCQIRVYAAGGVNSSLSRMTAEMDFEAVHQHPAQYTALGGFNKGSPALETGHCWSVEGGTIPKAETMVDQP